MAEIDTIRSILMKLLDFVETLFVVVGHLILIIAIISVFWIFDISANEILTLYKNNPASKNIEAATGFLLFFSGLSGYAILKLYVKFLRKVYSATAGKLLLKEIDVQN